mmetsp:Transcript_57629/g.119758  ORF Transcript_57629/g.119758 Transcript_57629/m.119758 type:complete len:179 (-) Transcript_57629:63-599(-)
MQLLPLENTLCFRRRWFEAGHRFAAGNLNEGLGLLRGPTGVKHPGRLGILPISAEELPFLYIKHSGSMTGTGTEPYAKQGFLVYPRHPAHGCMKSLPPSFTAAVSYGHRALAAATGTCLPLAPISRLAIVCASFAHPPGCARAFERSGVTGFGRPPCKGRDHQGCKISRSTDGGQAAK